jgi:oligopeptide/dipeptide ABC transporter ATP-binding protein
MREVLISDPEERFYSYPHELSGGMRQRIVIAIALAGDPKVLFADEPTTSLDVTTQAQIMEVLESLRENRSLAVVLITHDLSIAASRVERVYVMYAGKIVEELPVADLARRSQMPYTQALLRAVPSATGDRSIMPAPLVGAPPDPQFMPTGCRFHPRCPRVHDECLATEPQLLEISPWHKSACLFPGPDEFIGAGVPSGAGPLQTESD